MDGLHTKNYIRIIDRQKDGVNKMRDIKRIEPFLKDIEKVWKKHPDLRFMQMINNVMASYRSDLFFIEEEDFIKMLKGYYGED